MSTWYGIKRRISESSLLVSLLSLEYVAVRLLKIR